MQEAKVSVIVPVYNVEKYIDRCVSSILRQTYKNIEVILVDDGSPDNCGKIIDDYAKKDSRIKIIHQENAGLSMARNEAIKIATGEYFCFVDSDDYLDDNQIQRLIELLYDYNADISMTHFCYFSGDKVSRSDIKDKAGNTGLGSDTTDIVELSNIDCIRNMHMVTDELYVVMWGKLFKRELFDEIFFPAGRICEDLAILYKIYDRAKSVVYSKEVLYFYFKDNANSVTFSIKDKFYRDVFMALDEEIEYMSKHHEDLTDYPRKTYMYWIFDYYCKLSKSKEKNADKMKQLHIKYKQLYKESKALNKEKFYTFFNYLPNLYLKLKGIN